MEETVKSTEKELLKVENLQVRFVGRKETVYAVNGVSFSVKNGETLGIVGESGSGKSVSMLSMMGLMPSRHGRIAAGEAVFKGTDLLKLNRNEMNKIRGKEVGFVFQDPIVSFNPVYTLGDQLMEPLITHKMMTKSEAYDRACEMLELVKITNPKERLKAFPHQFSGGMRQRVMIAMALICNPELIIADEPTTALDVTIQAQIVDLVKDLQARINNATIWITHDLSLLAGLADNVAVMYGGTIIEMATIDEIFARPTHPYTIGLLESLPKIDGAYERLKPIDGTPPVLKEFPSFCPFANRCHKACDRCRAEKPELKDIGGGHKVACFLNS